MNRIRVIYLAVLFTIGVCLAYFWLAPVMASSAAQSVTTPKPAAETVKEAAPPIQQPVNASRAAREEKSLQDARRQELAEKEAALAAKEQELKKLSDKLEAQIKTMEETKKRLDESLKQKKKTLDEKRKRMLTLIKKMRPEQAGQFLGKMEEVAVISILNDLDNKMVLKLMPYLNQPMVLKWIKDNLNNT